MTRRRAPVPATAQPQAQVADKPLPSLADRQRDTAEYLTDMILEMRNLARSLRLHNVMVPLEFAYYEAFGVAHRVEVPSAELDRIRELSKAAEALDRDPPNARG